MMNKKGSWGVVIILIALVVLTGFIIGYSGEAKRVWTNRMGEPSVSFGEVIGGTSVEPGAFRFFDYIFGKIPSHLAQWRADAVSGAELGGAKYSAAIITIAIWLLFVLAFGDILSTFGFFSKTVSWLVAVILTIIAANIQLLKFVSVVGLSVTAIFGTASVLLSILWVFVFFVLFHFGSYDLRKWAIKRRGQDVAMRAAAGSTKAAAGLKAAKEFANAAASEE